MRKVLEKKNVKKLMILATPQTINTDLYTFPNIQYHNPNSEEQQQLSKIIFEYNRKGYDKEDGDIVRKMIKKYQEKGAQCVLLGCTEFAGILKGESLQKVDSVEVLVNAVAERQITRFK